jgi:hypothetical protein
VLIGIERLKKIIADTSECGIGRTHHNCIDCGFPVEIEVHKTVGGYGLLGGVLYEIEDCLYARCADCYKNDPNLNSNLDALKKVLL